MNKELPAKFDRLHTLYYSSSSDEFHSSIWSLLQSGLWKATDPFQFEQNNLLGVLKRNEWKPIFADLIPIYPGMELNRTTQTAFDPTYIPSVFHADWDTVVAAAASFFQAFEGKKIGVQLSGGLDSSIIIGLLNYLKIPFYLVGMTTNRYEFRTERYIQELLIPLAKEAVLLDYGEYLPLSNLLDVPVHQYPELLSINYSSENAMALACQKLGVEILLTGDGGDNLFAEEIPMKPEQCPWLPQVFSDPWPAEYIYQPRGVSLVPFFADEGFMDCIFNLRRGKGEDNSKWWARKYFERILPRELVNYKYCADFWGLYVSGMQEAIPTIKVLFDQAFELTGNKIFSSSSTTSLLGQDMLDPKKEMYQTIEARIAFAVWLHGLKKTGIAS